MISAKIENSSIYTPAEQAHLAAARQMAAEGMVLLENNGLLPMSAGTRLAVFGVGVYEFAIGGHGSGAVSGDGRVDLPQALSDAGFIVYGGLEDAYRAHISHIESEKLKLPFFDRPNGVTEMPMTPELVDKAASFSDTALVVISRVAGEGADRKAVPGDYYLNSDEENLLSMVRAAFTHVTVVLNIANIMDMSFVDAYSPDAVLISWLPGQEGPRAVADILSGAVCPSGRLPDTVAYRLEDHPSTENFGAWVDGFEDYTGTADQVEYWGGMGNRAAVPVGETVRRPVNNRWFVEYQEGLYVGYRYFSTFGVPVRYPFGYGLSYTSFRIDAVSFSRGDGCFTVEVCVANTGSVAGKEVVQVYIQGAETTLERPQRELAAFGKTSLLAPGESETLSFTVTDRQISSYSEERAAYVLQAGGYSVYIGKNVCDFRLAGGFTVAAETVTEQLTNRLPLTHTRPLRQLTKHDPKGSWPQCPPLRFDTGENPAMFIPSYTFDLPRLPEGKYKLADVKSGKVSTEEFLAQMEDFELVCLLLGSPNGQSEVMSAPDTKNQDGSTPADDGPGIVRAVEYPPLGPLSDIVPGAAGQTATLERLGIPSVFMSDGPAGVSASSKANKLAFPTAQVVSSSWNTALAREMGAALGQEAAINRIDVWLAPALNLHRNPLCGRNYEYYSEDPLLSGKMAAAISQGAAESNVTSCVKHFAANNQETSRWMGVDSVMTERVARELYLRGFEIAVKEGRGQCVMTAYNSLNGHLAAASLDLNTHVLREEWGFDGFVVTDWEGDGIHPEAALAAGNDVLMPGYSGQLKDMLGKLEKGMLDRTVLEKCAANLLRFVMNSNSFLRYTQRG